MPPTGLWDYEIYDDFYMLPASLTFLRTHIYFVIRKSACIKKKGATKEKGSHLCHEITLICALIMLSSHSSQWNTPIGVYMYEYYMSIV